MSTKSDKLLIAKTKLSNALGEANTKIYMNNLKMWFRKLWTREQFDFECRKLFTAEKKHLHNEFFLAILNKIMVPLYSSPIATNISHDQTMSKSSKKRKRTRLSSERAIFEPIELYDYLPEDNSDLRPPSTPLPQPRFAAQELFLPDNGLILGRLLIAAWENGLSNADENVCELIVTAVQTLLKNILTAIMTTRKHCKTTSNGNYFYDVGCDIKNPFLKNTATRQIIDEHPFEVDKEISSINTMRRMNDDTIFLSACENTHMTSIKGRITILDVYNALQNKNVIPCHSVYANNIERISQMLN